MKIEDAFYLDSVTFVAVFNNETDNDGDDFNYEIEYHEDEEKWVATKVFDYEVVSVELKDLPDGMLEMAKEEHDRLDNKGSVSTCIYAILQNSIPKDYIAGIRDNILNDVINDLIETADDDWNNDDVALAIGRVLLVKTENK